MSQKYEIEIPVQQKLLDIVQRNKKRQRGKKIFCVQRLEELT